MRLKIEFVIMNKKEKKKGEVIMTEESRKKLDSIFDSSLEYEIVENQIVPDKIVCPDCGGVTFDGLDLCHLCGGMLINI